MKNQDIIDSDFNEGNKRIIEKPRAGLIPIWLMIFMYFFLLYGIFALITLLLHLYQGQGDGVSIILYGLERWDLSNSFGVCIYVVLFFKAFVAWELIREKKWAVDLAIVDNAFGMLACVLMMFVVPYLEEELFLSHFRPELFLLVPFLMAMLRIKDEWRTRLSKSELSAKKDSM
ncbi:MAG: hypothetical protein ACPG5P_05150 [Saprospiraceae bacterium]